MNNQQKIQKEPDEKKKDRLRDEQREYWFFRHALCLHDSIKFGNRRKLRETFVAKVKPATRIITEWKDIKLEDNENLNLPVGYKGYERAVDILINSLCCY